MAFLKPERPRAICKICEMIFQTFSELRKHKVQAHQRYDSVDKQWGNLGEDKKDFWICQKHRKKLNDDFQCPEKGCPCIVRIRKSEFLNEEKIKPVKTEKQIDEEIDTEYALWVAEQNKNCMS